MKKCIAYGTNNVYNVYNVYNIYNVYNVYNVYNIYNVDCRMNTEVFNAWQTVWRMLYNV